MKNVTIVLDEEVARWIRIRAAEQETSVSRLVGQLLRQMMEGQRNYEAAWDAFTSIEPKRLRKKSESLPSREALYERDIR